jgi:CubicO group peptidase (beta-lactamase class C family)
MVDVHGFCDERFAAIGDLFRANLRSGTDEGASLAVAMRGEFVVDMWGGFSDRAHARAWEKDTLARVCSTSKIIVAIAVLMLWDRGLLDLDEPIATYWPEFAQNGKDTVTARHVLVHSSGLPGYGQILSIDVVQQWDRMVSMIERAELWHEPGAITCYHGNTFGFILGELIHRVSGLAFTHFVANEITEPLDADFHYSLSASRDIARIAEHRLVVDTVPNMLPMGERASAEFAEYAFALIDTQCSWVVDPGGSGITNARALARIGSIMALRGEVDGRRYLSERVVEDATREHSYAEDQIQGWIRRGLFFGLDSREYPAPSPTTVHWGGMGGSWMAMDPATGISSAYTPNRLLIGDAELVRQNQQWQALTDVLATLD